MMAAARREEWAKECLAVEHPFPTTRWHKLVDDGIPSEQSYRCIGL